MLIKNLFSLIGILLVFVFVLMSCSSKPDVGFGVYLVDSGELVISGRDVKAFRSADRVIELNNKGIKRWNSFISYQGIPKLKDTLFSKDFVIIIEGKEIATGKFWSFVSSATYSGIVILDSLSRLDNANNQLRIDYSYPPSLISQQDTTVISELTRFFQKINLLE